MKHDEWYFLDTRCWRRREALEKRLKVAEDRTESLLDALTEAEKADELDPTPENAARFDRIDLIHSRASSAQDILEERIELIQKIASLHEQELELADGAERRRMRKVRERRAAKAS